jgi:hypothetical protein
VEDDAAVRLALEGRAPARGRAVRMQDAPNMSINRRAGEGLGGVVATLLAVRWPMR